MFADRFSAYEKATTQVTDHLVVLLSFSDFRLEHWVHPRTTSSIESTFSTMRLRTKVTRGARTRKAGLAMAYKLPDSAQACWRRITAAALVPLVRAGATFIDGTLHERSNQATQETTGTDEESGVVAARLRCLVHAA